MYINTINTGEDVFRRQCIIAISNYYTKMGYEISYGDIFIVWQCKTLQNWKAMASTYVSDGRYFEITYNGDKGELYLDVYRKEHNECIG